MIYIKTEEEIEKIRENCLLVSRTHAMLAPYIKPGVSTKYLDDLAEEFIRDNGAEPACKGYMGYPSATCMSKNSVIVHGIPSEKDILEEGDILSVDLCTRKYGFIGDSAYTFAVGEISEDVKRLLDTTKAALYKGIENAVVGKRVGDISNSVQQYCEAAGYSCVREMVGHGLGKGMHEDPQVPNYGRRGQGPMLKSNMVICIEPMINMGKHNISIDNDGWTARTLDGKWAAHYEHAVVVRKGKAEILSDFSIIEEALRKR